VSLPLLTITDKSQAGMKQVVLVTARMHPGESVSSHVTEGFIRELLKNQAEILRNF
jgi:murein tripeptide amidase MpaA